MKLTWKIRQSDQDTASDLAQQMGLHPLTARLLNNRSIFSLEEAEHFLHPSLKDLPPPSLLKDIDVASARIVAALENKEEILVFGDYDVDGVTATSLLYSFLQNAGARISYYIPNRITEGYGLKPLHITSCALNRKTKLIITVDCGSTSHKAIREARQHNIDVIVTDHHALPEELPDALAVINPKRNDGVAGLGNLAGVGVAFYLIIRLRMQLRETGYWRGKKEPNLKKACDLVALGTVADVVPMVNANRILTRAGLDELKTRGNGGIRILIERCGIDKRYIDAADIAFKLAPRLNAAGRLAHADDAMALLTADNPQDAAKHAGHLHALNLKRREMEREILEEIDARLNRHPLNEKTNIILLHGRNWHIGILGIVASRLVRRFARPVIVLTLEGDFAKGSARSIPGIDLAGLLSACTQHLISHGGHAMAAGLQLHADKIEGFRDAIEQCADKIMGRGMAPPSLEIDSELDFNEISRAFIDEMELLKPFGEKNPEPLFAAQNVSVTQSKILSGGHRRMMLKQAEGRSFQAIHFNPDPGLASFDFFRKIAYRLQINRWNGAENIQLMIEDISN